MCQLQQRTFKRVFPKSTMILKIHCIKKQDQYRHEDRNDKEFKTDFFFDNH